ncbi:MAG: methylated-DNA--[protein]-cysteine S-methyltransferase [Lachnospiraceae bacterium]|nr:methylated-DNA--[protein]-cysteine S-methyltransferase [Lachnospiraceae bacterium]
MYLHTPVGELELVADTNGLCRISFGKTAKASDICEEEIPVLRKAIEQLSEYFAGQRKVFELPLSLRGTDFQLRDWNALLEIPYGETRSYKDIAEAVGCPRGFRAVGMANRRNPLPIVVPCHRVIGADGSLTGYAGANKALAIKEYLLKLEGAR